MNTSKNIKMYDIERISGNIEREQLMAWALAKYDSLPQRFFRLVKRLKGKSVMSRTEYIEEWAKLLLTLFPTNNAKW